MYAFGVDSVYSLQMKTGSVLLTMCLNIGVDPPDVVKTSPCARLECWIGEKHDGPLFTSKTLCPFLLRKLLTRLAKPCRCSTRDGSTGWVFVMVYF